LARQLSEEAFQELRQAVHRRAGESLYHVPVSGIKIALGVDVPRCEITVKGREFPELIPEAEYWEPYLHIYAASSIPYRVGEDNFNDVFLKGIQQNQLAIAVDSLRLFLNIARQTIADIDNKRESRVAESQIAALVMDTRQQLIRRFSAETWSAIQRDAFRVRSSAVFRFSSTR
jgi:hypothetical protein